MSERDSDFTPDQKVALQRLATLQRLRENARRRNQPAMLSSLNKIIELETRLLRESTLAEKHT